METLIQCLWCNGTGKKGKFFKMDCGGCQGTGVVTSLTNDIQVNNIQPEKVICLKCKNTGVFTQDSGYLLETKFCFCPVGKEAAKVDFLEVEKENTFGYDIQKLDNALAGLKKKNIPGLEIVNPSQNELQLDYDQDTIPEQFFKVLELLRHRFPKGKLKWEKFRSSSGKHWHVVVTLPDTINDQERIVWQAVFGSDYIRESLNLLRVIHNLNNPIALYMQHDRVPVEIGEIPERPGRKFKDA